ncbi:MAG: hypothetical protein ACRD2U_10920 [Terriglobales bacterium]
MSYLKHRIQKPWTCGLLLIALTPLAGWAQADNAPAPPPQSTGAVDQTTGESQPAEQTTPPPAFGMGAAVTSPNENPPVSGLDQPSLEPGAITRSFLAAGAILSESGDSNIEGSFGSGRLGPGGVTRAMGTVSLQKIWSRYETDLQYIGGGAFYEAVNHNADQLHQAEFAQRAIWRTGQLVFRDSVSYLPEGAFGSGSYGGSGALQSSLTGLHIAAGGISAGPGSALGGNFSADQFGSISHRPRLTNSATADLVEAVTPRSSFTLAGSYGFVHFTDNPEGLIDSNQTVAEFGYDHQINRTDQLAVSYGFQNFSFPQIAASSVRTNTVNLIYGHRITGRIDVVLAAGPQFTAIYSPLFGSSHRISANGNAKLRYRFQRASLQLEYKHHNTNGSGYFLGSDTDSGAISILRPLGRVWETSSDIGVANNKRIVSAATTVPATSDLYLYAGGAVHRHIGRRYRLFLSYQYNRLSFDESISQVTGSGRISTRHMGALGIEWYPRPVRLD